MTAPNLRDVVAAVIVERGEVLACRRRPDIASGGLWEFPGGKVELGETFAAALEREILEELGVLISVGELLIAVERPDAGIRLLCLEASLASDRPTRSTDHDALEWVEFGSLLGRNWAPADVPAVELLALRSV